jgi:hypothetical protein
MTILDWRKHHTGEPAPCVLCGQPALMRDHTGAPCHKVCAETLPASADPADPDVPAPLGRAAA